MLERKKSRERTVKKCILDYHGWLSVNDIVDVLKVDGGS